MNVRTLADDAGTEWRGARAWTPDEAVAALHMPFDDCGDPRRQAAIFRRLP